MYGYWKNEGGKFKNEPTHKPLFPEPLQSPEKHNTEEKLYFKKVTNKMTERTIELLQNLL